MSTGASVLDHVLIWWSKNGPATGRRPTGTGMDGRVIQLVAVIVGQLLPCPDIPTGDNPDGAARLLHVTVWVTRMVDVAGLVPVGLCVNVIALIQRKDIDRLCWLSHKFVGNSLDMPSLKLRKIGTLPL